MARSSRMYVYVCCQGKSCSWVSESCQWRDVRVSRLADVHHDSYLPLWRVTIDLDAPPHQVLHRLRSPQTLHSTFSRWKILERLGDDVDLVEYVATSPALDRARHFRLIRYRNVSFVFYLLNSKYRDSAAILGTRVQQ